MYTAQIQNNIIVGKIVEEKIHLKNSLKFC